MKLLALDTSSEACSVALSAGDVIEERFAIVEQSHSQEILGMVQQLLTAAELSLSQLDAIAFGRGPGSFTGLRICAGVTQGLAFAADLPVVPVSSLAALAQGADANRVFAALDARMGQVYYGAYERQEGVPVLVGQEAVAAPDSVPLPTGRGWVGAGSGWDHYAAELQNHFGAALEEVRSGRYPHAREIAVLARDAFNRGRVVPPEQAIPVYIRDDVAKKSVR